MELGFCEKGLLGLIRKSNPAPFLLKTYMLVDDEATDKVISWNDDGTAFVVWQPPEFARDVLPTLFKHSNFSSFVRQLNTYGFRKVATNRWEFCNDKFRKGEKDLLCEIRRRKAWSHNTNKNNNNNQSAAPNLAEESAHEDPEAAPCGAHHGPPRPESWADEDERSSSTSTSSEFSVLVDENKRLKRENGALSNELMSMKRKCRELLDLVAKYAREDHDHDHDHDGDDDDDDYDGDDHRPKLFGVRLEVEGKMLRKRKRVEVSQSARVLLSQVCK